MDCRKLNIQDCFKFIENSHTKYRKARFNGNKNIRSMVDTTGNEVATYDYTPFGGSSTAGQVTPAGKNNPFRFSSEYHDDETGLVYYNYRYYSPELGRWLSRDPIEEKGGYNLYGMVGNNPVDYWDELGLKCVNCKKLKQQINLLLAILKTYANMDVTDEMLNLNWWQQGQVWFAMAASVYGVINSASRSALSSRAIANKSFFYGVAGNGMVQLTSATSLLKAKAVYNIVTSGYARAAAFGLVKETVKGYAKLFKMISLSVNKPDPTILLKEKSFVGKLWESFSGGSNTYAALGALSDSIDSRHYYAANKLTILNNIYIKNCK